MAQGDKTLQAAINLALQVDAAMELDLGHPGHTAKDAVKATYQSGDGVNQVNEFFCDERTIIASEEEELDLFATVPGGDTILKNAWGDEIDFASIKVIFVRNLTTTTTFKLQVGGHATLAFTNWVVAATDAVNIGAGGVFLITSPVDGWAVTDETGDILLIKNPNAGPVTYRIILVGVKA